MERFAKLVNAEKAFTIFAKAPSYIFDRVCKTPNRKKISNEHLMNI